MTKKPSPKKTVKNLNFLKKRHELTGFDSDYIAKLNPDEAAWLETFARAYYDGAGPQSPARKEANHRRYTAKKADCMSVLDTNPADFDRSMIDDLDPEKLLLLKEELAAMDPKGFLKE